jgi:methylthioribulose-1-phosphate dehydratase
MKTIAILSIMIPLLGVGQESPIVKAAEEIVQVGHFLNELGLCSATAGNFSSRINSDLFAITVSGKHKGELTADDVMLVNGEGKSIDGLKKPSAETALHMVVYRLFSRVGAVLHTHSVNGTVLSRLIAPKTAIVTEGYEIHKAFGIPTHESTMELPIFENSQDYPALSAEIAAYLESHPEVFGFFLRGHGLYTWGKDIKEAKIRTEAYEFLFDCELKSILIQRN